MIEIGTAISSLAALKTIFDGAVAVRDDTKLMEVKLAFQQQLFEVQSAMLSVQSAYAQVLQENRELTEAKRVAEQFTADAQGYEPFEAAPGVFVYALQTSDGARPKLPYFCYACHKERKQSILSIDEAKSSMSRSALQCVSSEAHRFELPRHWRREHVANGLPAD